MDILSVLSTQMTTVHDDYDMKLFTVYLLVFIIFIIRIIFFCTYYKLSFPFSWYKYTRVMTYDLFNIYLTIDLLLYLYYYLDLWKKKIKQIFLSMYIKWTRAITPVIQFNLIEGYLGKIWGWIYFLLYIIWWHILDTRQLYFQQY